MVEEAYISFETAKLLKEKGYLGPCSHNYRRNGILYRDHYSPGLGDVLAPSHQLACRWLREIHNVYIDVTPVFERHKFSYYDVLVGTPEMSEQFDILNNFKTYEEATEAAIKYCLENLI